MKLLQFLLLTTLFFGCAKSADESAGMDNLTDGISPTEKTEDNLRKLIKEGSLRFRTENIHKTHDLIRNSLKGFGAYISEESTFNYSNETGYDLTVRVPAANFDSLLNYIVNHVNIKELDSKSTQIKDVTEEFIDVEARIKIKKESEQKLTDLMKQSKNLSETLEIQKQLTDLRADIESVEGRLKYLNDQVSYSTINISFYENIKYSKRFFTDFWDALKDGWQVFLHVLTLMAYLWVVLLVFFTLRYGYKYYKKKRVKKD
jgi:hypothetical protein